MVRIIAAFLFDRYQKLSNNDIILAFDTNDRRMLGPTAPAKGLELAKVFMLMNGGMYMTDFPSHRRSNRDTDIDIHTISALGECSNMQLIFYVYKRN